MDKQLVIPKMLLAVYENEDSKAYIESAAVNDQGYPDAFRPLTREMAVALGHSLSEKNAHIVDGYVPANLQYFSYKFDKIDRLLWWTPPQKRFIRFGDKNEKMKDGNINVPYLVWCYKNNGIYLYAMLEAPKMNTLIFHAPFYNIHEVGAVCMGSGQQNIKGATMIEFIKNCEDAFWGTIFTYPHTQYVVQAKTIEDMKPIYRKIVGSNIKLTDKLLCPFMMKLGVPKGVKPKRMMYEDLYVGIRNT